MVFKPPTDSGLDPMNTDYIDHMNQKFGGSQAMGYPSGDVSHMPPPNQGTGATASGPLEFKADTNAGLDALAKRYNSHLDDIENNTGRIMDQRGSRLRDAREGGARALGDASLQSGHASDPAVAQYASDTTRGVESAVADVAQEQQNALTSALQGGVAVNRAPSDLALDEKRFQLSAYQADSAAKNQSAQLNLQALMASLNAQRDSPIYNGQPAMAPVAQMPAAGPVKGAVQTGRVRYS